MPRLVTPFAFGTVAVITMIAYLLPALIGWSRHVLGLGSVAVINIAAELDLWSPG